MCQFHRPWFSGVVGAGLPCSGGGVWCGAQIPPALGEADLATPPPCRLLGPGCGVSLPSPPLLLLSIMVLSFYPSLRRLFTQFSDPFPRALFHMWLQICCVHGRRWVQGLPTVPSGRPPPPKYRLLIKDWLYLKETEFQFWNHELNKFSQWGITTFLVLLYWNIKSKFG